MGVAERLAEVERATPPERDRLVDLLRTLALLVVIAGHWLIAVVLVVDGEVVGDHLLALLPATQWLTWALQVMPLFFLVGGRVNGAGWERARAAGQPASAWILARTTRLVRPVLPLVGLWAVLTPVLALTGLAPDLLQLGSRAVLMPLWFLAVYLGVVLLVPVTWAAHRRAPWTSLGVLLATAVVVDVLRRLGVPGVGWTNFAWVWLAIHQLGYLWHDRWLPTERRSAGGLVVLGLLGLLLLTELLGYPRSMVGVPGELATNNTPPTVALLVLTGVQLGVVLLAADRLRRALARPAVWTPVALLGRRALPLFLWHQSAMMLVIAGTVLPGWWPATARVDATWWLQRPLWFLLLGTVLAGLTALAAQLERLWAPGPSLGHAAAAVPHPGRVVVGVVSVVAGLGWVTLTGLYDPGRTPAMAVGPLLLLLVGTVTLGLLPRAVPRHRAPSSS